MRIHRSAIFAAVAFAMGVGPVLAQDGKTVEVTPYLALGSQGAAPLGIAITFPITSKVGLETDVAYCRGEGNINALSSDASLVLFLPRLGQSAPYIVGGIGLAQYGAPVFSAAGGPPIGTESRVGFRVNAGAGLKMPMTDKVDMRTDARWYKSFGKQGSEQFRVAQGVAFDLRKR